MTKTNRVHLLQLFPCEIDKYIIELATAKRVPEIQVLVNKKLLKLADDTSVNDIPDIIENDYNYVFLLIDKQTNEISGIFSIHYTCLIKLKHDYIKEQIAELGVQTASEIPQENMNAIEEFFQNIDAESVIHISYEILPPYRDQGLHKYVITLLGQLEKIFDNSIWFFVLDTCNENYKVQLSEFQSIKSLVDFKPVVEVDCDQTINLHALLAELTIDWYVGRHVDRSRNEFQAFYKHVPNFQKISQH